MATKTRGKGEGSVYQDKRGLWTAVIELPQHDGKRRRKWLRRTSKKELLEAMKVEVEQLRQRGDLPTSDMTLEQWMNYWVEQIAAKEVRPKTLSTYRSFVSKRINPVIGSTRLSRVSPTHIRRVTDAITGEAGLSAETALSAHKVLAVALEHAMRDNRIPRNPTKLMTPPRRPVSKLEVFTLDEARQVIELVKNDQEYGARWAMALLTGARRGEVLGLEADRVTDVIDLSWQLQRLHWTHGCKDGACGRKRAGECPERYINAPNDFEYRPVKGGLFLTRPKTRAGWRIIPLVPPLSTILEGHMARNPPNEDGLVFTHGGKAVDPDLDTEHWNRVLKQSGIDKKVRLHDLRHAAVDILYHAGVPEDLIVQIVGHSTRAMTRSYASKGNIVRLREAMTLMSAQFAEPPRQISQ